jgi:alkanesulfonate monooxygenase SsuD/methylene tetrahydromethanopterin reductase-like flavin-dependent oxidoreductase (luciferase family)
MGGALRVGIGLPTRVAEVSSDLLVEWAARADRGPFSSLAVVDRVVSQALEPLVALAAVGLLTKRVRLMTSIVLGPTRETTLLARQAASIDALSGGRLSLGLGVGVRQVDYLATGYDFRRRGRRLDEQLATLRRIWSGVPLSEEAGVIGPASPRPGGPELLLGSYVPVVAQRIAAWGDGFMAPGGGEPAAMLELWRQIERAWLAAGRPGRPRWVGASYFALGPNADEAASAYIQANYGYNPPLAERRRRELPTTRQAVEETIMRQAELGADELILRPCAGELDQLDRLAEIVTHVAPPA